MHMADFKNEYDTAKVIATKYPHLVDSSMLTEEIYKRAYNIVTTRCFGWSTPSTCLVPLADCFNHFNIDNQYEIFNSNLHIKLAHHQPGE